MASPCGQSLFAKQSQLAAPVDREQGTCRAKQSQFAGRRLEGERGRQAVPTGMLRNKANLSCRTVSTDHPTKLGVRNKANSWVWLGVVDWVSGFAISDLGFVIYNLAVRHG